MVRKFVYGSKDKLKKRNEWWDPKISYSKKKKKFKSESSKKYGSKGNNLNDPIPAPESYTALKRMALQTNKDFLKNI